MMYNQCAYSIVPYLYKFSVRTKRGVVLLYTKLHLYLYTLTGFHLVGGKG